ncbi:MAG: hypothetical protein JWP26_2292 [Devosia sp.]|uniref:lysozyme inhibitor LprI family protein n=1 Tax=Devosia sp. TaxID=1871048 RepID=UPI002617390D|nr:lysozyme inhibitor LprI family protein [Devosia sp.]MDB5587322.1 hypothetical protein [Devosia sp.]
MKFLLAAALTFACFATAMAQEPSYTSDDEMALQQCIEAVNDTNNSKEPTDTASMHDCIGAASGLCQDVPGGDSTQGMTACNQREQAWWDQYLNSNYADLQASLEPAVFDSLKTAQRAWLKFRDADCAFADALWQGGTIRSVMASACMMNATATRAVELANTLNETSH